MEIFNRIEALKILPVAVVDRPDDAIALADALARGGLPAAEITFRTDRAADSIALLRAERPDMLVGAGTVLTPAQVESAARAGAQFLVSPGLNPNTLAAAREVGLPMLPGVLTPSEIERALELGLTRVKFFPAEAGGGAAMIKSLSAPYRAMKFLPTGGVSAKNLASYLALPSVFACGLSSVCERSLVEVGDFAEIERRARELVTLRDEALKGARNG